jgi:hypothetical protein
MEAQRASLAACAASEFSFNPTSLPSKLSLWKLGGWKPRSPRGCTANGGCRYVYHIFWGHRRRRFRIGALASYRNRDRNRDQASGRHFLTQLLEGEATRLTVRYGSTALVRHCRLRTFIGFRSRCPWNELTFFISRPSNLYFSCRVRIGSHSASGDCAASSRARSRKIAAGLSVSADRAKHFSASSNSPARQWASPAA